GAMYEGFVDSASVGELKRSRRVTQSMLVEGRRRVRLYEPAGAPPEGFEPVAATLEDAYLVLQRAEENEERLAATGTEAWR
ncbi:MAG: hypothetical protein HZA53_00925, partial [Planctomycetes bacterium]|nr:hypothetical protein [Planctomycetota bacterium]